MVLGANMVIERGDPDLSRAARDVLAKVQTVVPQSAADQMWKAALLVPHRLEDGVSFGRFVPGIRQAIRDSRKLRIRYVDAKGEASMRTGWPLGLYLFSHVTLVCAWCELRGDYRGFRSKRITECEMMAVGFDPKGGTLMSEFLLAFGNRTGARASQPR